MGNSCSSGQGHKDKDTISQRSEESASYQIKTHLPSQKHKTLLNHIESTSHSGIIMEPILAGRQTTLEDRKPNLTKILKNNALPSISADSLSLSSPLKETKQLDKMEEKVSAEVGLLSECLQNLILGRVSQTKVLPRTNKIVIYVSAADSNDCRIEKTALHNLVYPELRLSCLRKGYELHLVDLHWKTPLEKQQDHEFPELCISELLRQVQIAHVIPVLFLNNSLGSPLLPISIESSDFKIAMDNSSSNQSAQCLLSKWYQLDNESQPPSYKLKPVYSNIPAFRDPLMEEHEKALGQWQNEIENMLSVLISVFSQELRDVYFTTVVEQEVHNTVFMSQDLAKRCIWMYRPSSLPPKESEQSRAVQKEQFRRLELLQKDLREQLSDRNIITIPAMFKDGDLSSDVVDQDEYMNSITKCLKSHLNDIIENIIVDHESKKVLKSWYGIEALMFKELNHQFWFCQQSAQNSIAREKIMNNIKDYLVSDVKMPLVLYGTSGSGKSTIFAKVAQACHEWIPEAFLVFRFVGISEQSSTLDDLLSSIVNQCSILVHGKKCYCAHNAEEYKKMLTSIMFSNNLQRPLIIILDGLNHIKYYSRRSLNWLPDAMPHNVKLMISIAENTFMYDHFKQRDEIYFLKIPNLVQSETDSILTSCIMQYNRSLDQKIQEYVSNLAKGCVSPLYAKVLAWQSSWMDRQHKFQPKGDIDQQLQLMLKELESTLGTSKVEHALSLLSCAKHGLTDSEVIDMMAFTEHFPSNTTYVTWAPVCLVWARLNKYLAPFFHWYLTGDCLVVQWKDNDIKETVLHRYKQSNLWAHQTIHDYFKGKWSVNHHKNTLARSIPQTNLFGTCFNKRKLDELPYHHYKINLDIENSEYIINNNWLYDKICGSTVHQLLEDIQMQYPIKTEYARVLKEFLEIHASSLHYDGKQYYSLLYEYLYDKKIKNEINFEEDVQSKLNKWFNLAKNPPRLSLLVQEKPFSQTEERNRNETESSKVDGDNSSGDQNKNIDMIVALPNSKAFVVSLSSTLEEIVVWDVIKSEKIRTLSNIPQPTMLIPIDKYKCVVLCKRELVVYDLSSGSALTRLKGVMNQKMPYYGLHDKEHLVALSRNRMYINLMNLTSGDCITTFKAGEDRFLNSLLVSADGKILVCGDETQKPFPLLVWNLQSRKLLYDLRIPHHDFDTSLSAITQEGNYVCCVCYEIDEPDPNFIVVYDLQSGTLFKKWKPACNTVSLAISSTAGCVVSGLDDSRLLVWDLVTGNCRFTLLGHSAPVSVLKLDSTGCVCLSTDNKCRDRSLRVWDLNIGELLSVYTPSKNIAACELTSNGRHIVIALENHPEIISMRLDGPDLQFPDEPEEPFGEGTNNYSELYNKNQC